MNKIILVALALILAGCAGAHNDPVRACLNETARYQQVCSAEIARLSGEVAALTRRIDELTQENARLREEIAQINNERLLYQNAARDSRTVNAIALWHTFAWDVRIAVIAVIVALVALGVVAFASMRRWYSGELRSLRNDLVTELREARKLSQLWREAYAEAAAQAQGGAR